MLWADRLLGTIICIGFATNNKSPDSEVIKLFHVQLA